MLEKQEKQLIMLGICMLCFGNRIICLVDEKGDAVGVERFASSNERELFTSSKLYCYKWKIKSIYIFILDQKPMDKLFEKM